MRKVKLGNTDESISVLGQGTYGIFPGRNEFFYMKWKQALRKGIELGMTHIDTAEMYGGGYSEKIIGDVLSSIENEDIFIGTKVLPSRTDKDDIIKAANESLNRLRVNKVDLFLIHWLEDDSPLKIIMKALEELVEEGITRYIGVSNFSVEEFQEAQSYLKNNELVTNQLEINLVKQDEIIDNLDFYQEENVTLIAYSPLNKNNFSGLNKKVKKNLKKIAEKHEATIQQIALAWLINHDNVVAIPRSSSIEHMKENAQAAEIELSEEELEMLTEK